MILSWWRAYQRKIDLNVLWPICKREAAAQFDNPETALQLARAAFAVHVFNDPAWKLAMDEDSIIEFVDQLE
jgi:hypothetical protein